MNWELLKYLITIHHRMSKRLAKTSRLFLLKKAFFEIRGNKDLPVGDILIDYNKNKLKSFEKLAGKKLYYLNPNKISFPLIFRPLLILTVLFNQKFRQIFYAFVMYHSVQRIIDSKCTLYFWNPYTTWHYSLSFLDCRKIAYIHTCYYPFFKADFYYANSFIIQLYGLDRYEHAVITPEHHFVDNEDPINFYFTQLTNVPPAEKRLRAFARYLRERGNKRLKVYIHYIDRDKDLSKTSISDLFDVISLEKSLLNLSKKQLSFSADSSIGFELLSIGVDHYIFYGETKTKPELNDYAKESERFLDLEEEFDKICERLPIFNN